ncbi:hypothetical protein [Jonesia quinghaiensis]|uniref:hypothetical protein n=1 Tax=Jonesia quinghaiensis TaxID=262806 RepID=UPI0006853759|nr:hypothetical protein [Jonesia quinghaiensis]
MSKLDGVFSPATTQRHDEVEALLSRIVVWGASRPDIVALGLAGSWARGAAGMHSDADVVVLTDAVGIFSVEDDWVIDAVGTVASITRTQTWGPLTERRVELASKFEVEFGFATPQWAALPPDGGTAHVVKDGFRILYDPEHVLQRLVTAVLSA